MTEESQPLEQNEEQYAEIESQRLDDSSYRKGEVIITLRRVHLYAIIMPLIFIFGLGLGYLARGWVPLPGTSEANVVDDVSEVSASDASSGTAAQDQTQPPSETPQVVRYDIPIDDDPMIGPADAPITIVEFSDYECPFCQRWHTEVFARLLEAYPDEVRLVYRDFPIESIHVNAKPAAQAANCANEQGLFWEYHDKLFSMELGLSTETYEEYADQLGLDTQSFQECIESDRYQEEVQADFDFAANLGVRSTPTFFINGIALVGAQPFEVFQEVIEKELAGEIP